MARATKNTKKTKVKTSKKNESVVVVDAEVVSSKVKKKKPTKESKYTPPLDIAELSESGTGLVPTDPLALYLTEIRKYPLLTKEEEEQLTVRYYKSKDPVAAEKLVTSNLRFVVKVAAEYAKYGAKIMDLIQEGNVGLMHAVREFNPYKGVRLITYAVWWIRGYIRDYMLKQYSMVRIGTTRDQKKLFYRLQKEQQKFESIGEQAPVALLSSRLDVSEKDVHMMQQRMTARDVSLDQPIDEESGAKLIDLQSSEEQMPDLALQSKELLQKLKEKVNEIRPQLNEKELAILDERIMSDEPKTLQEIGDRFGITRERARQLEERLIANLKENFFK